MTCQTCAHLDDSEADRYQVGMRGKYEDMAGVCTREDHCYNGQFVPLWLRGCPDYEPVALPQGDGDMGDAA